MIALGARHLRTLDPGAGILGGANEGDLVTGNQTIKRFCVVPHFAAAVKLLTLLD